MKNALIIFLLFSFLSCEKQNDEIKTCDSFSIKYSKKSAWVNYSFDAIIVNDSMHIKEISGLNQSIQEVKFKLQKEDIELIRENLSILETTDLRNSYGFGDDIPTDLPVKLFQYKTGTRSDSTSIMFPSEHELPEALDSLLITINSIINAYWED